MTLWYGGLSMADLMIALNMTLSVLCELYIELTLKADRLQNEQNHLKCQTISTRVYQKKAKNLGKIPNKRTFCRRKSN